MVELIEYVLVFGLTVSLSAFSVLIFHGSIPPLDQNQAKAQMDEIAGAAGLAALNGNATLVMPLSNVSLSCSQGVLSITAGGSSLSSPVGYPCNFRLDGVSCLCTLVFTRSQDGLMLRVGA
ncbi:MAG: hypothetical protein ABSA72_06060 [Nitrososphaerales archaeon]|jgi:hypothetical protein